MTQTGLRLAEINIDRRRMATVIAGIAAIGVIVTATVGVSPRLIWNASASAPLGLYWMTREPFSRGDLVLARLPESVRNLAATRGYLPRNVPLVKRIEGVSSDKVCSSDSQIFINGVIVAKALVMDSMGRPMPIWSGCHVLRNEVFLLMKGVPDSFDGRYFGPIPTASVIGKLTPIWTK